MMHYYLLEVRVVADQEDEGTYVGTWSSFAEHIHQAKQIFKHESGYVPPPGMSYILLHHPLRQNGWASRAPA